MFDVQSSASALTIKILCGIGIALFLIASTIILSLIPIYLPGHNDLTLNYIQQSQLFYVEYSITVDNETINYSAFTNDLTNAKQQLNQQLGLSPNTINIENIELVQQSSSGSGRRKKRALNYKMLLVCRANYPRTCRFTDCQQQFLADITERCSNYTNINFRLRSALVTDQIVQFDSKFIGFTYVVPADFQVINQTLTNVQLVQKCIGQNLNKRPVIIDTDVAVDDLWAILYLLNVPTVDILAITTTGTGFSAPFYATSNVLGFLGLLGCTDLVAVASGLSTSSLPTGWVIANNILQGTDTYLTSCLNQSTNIFLQPSPFDAIELIVYTLKYSQTPVDILALGPFTNIAAAISRDRSIIPKIGTLYVSGGQFQSISSYTSLVPNPNLGMYPYSYKTSGSGSNVFLDVLAVQRVDDSGIQNLVAIPTLVQRQLPANLTQVNLKLKELNITLSPFIYGFITSLGNCTNDSFISWWDNSAAALMVQMQNNLTNGFCTTLQKVRSLYVLSADADQLFGQGLIDFENTRPNTRGLSNYTICTQTNSDVFLTEFLTKIGSNAFDACQETYEDRFDLKLQSCLSTYGYS